MIPSLAFVPYSYSPVSNVAITPASLPLTSLQSVSQTFSANGYGQGASLTWSTSGTLPSNLSINATSGVISGQVLSNGNYSFSVNVQSSYGDTGNVSISGAVSAITLTVGPSSLSNCISGTSYSNTVTAVGGKSPYSFTNTGTVPAGLSLASTGVLSGTPTVSGTYSFTVTATDALGNQGSKAFSVTTSAVSLTVSGSSPSFTAGSTSSDWATISASGGSGSYSFSISSGAFPSGISLSSSGVISGTCSATGSWSCVVKVTDSWGNTGTKTLSGTISITSGSWDSGGATGSFNFTTGWYNTLFVEIWGGGGGAGGTGSGGITPHGNNGTGGGETYINQLDIYANGGAGSNFGSDSGLVGNGGSAGGGNNQNNTGGNGTIDNGNVGGNGGNCPNGGTGGAGQYESSGSNGNYPGGGGAGAGGTGGGGAPSSGAGAGGNAIGYYYNGAPLTLTGNIGGAGVGGAGVDGTPSGGAGAVGRIYVSWS